MSVIKGRTPLREAYASRAVAQAYVARRFQNGWAAGLHRRQAEILNGVIRTFEVKRALEIAPGPARLTCEVSDLRAGYLCDVNTEMLAAARERLVSEARVAARLPLRWTMVQADAFGLPFRRVFDLVYSFRFVRHLEEHDRAAVYRQVRSVLAAGGLFVLDAINEAVSAQPRRRRPHDYPIYDELYTQRRLEAELATYGFDVLALHGVTRHFALQQAIQVTVTPRSERLASHLIRAVEALPGTPLEWVVVCRSSAAASTVSVSANGSVDGP